MVYLEYARVVRTHRAAVCGAVETACAAEGEGGAYVQGGEGGGVAWGGEGLEEEFG